MRKADEQGLNAVGERRSAPTGGGRYEVILGVKKPDGNGDVTCDYDPVSGAQILPAQHS